MSWAIGWSHSLQRDIGYGVPALCDHPGCHNEIDRGLGYLCGDIHSDDGCGLHFCSKHLYLHSSRDGQLCERCAEDLQPFEAKPDLSIWLLHKLTHSSWVAWRDEFPDEVAKIKDALSKVSSVQLYIDRKRLGDEDA